uniref:Uncharacterized protein n=1 Tax=Poecilia formosa TaxID=48698 RepID=A0A096LSN1_POEFO
LFKPRLQPVNVDMILLKMKNDWSLMKLHVPHGLLLTHPNVCSVRQRVSILSHQKAPTQMELSGSMQCNVPGH